MTPEPHRCFVCDAEDLAPDVMPYVASKANPKAIETVTGKTTAYHVWAHQKCMAAYMDAHRKSLGVTTRIPPGEAA